MDVNADVQALSAHSLRDWVSPSARLKLGKGEKCFVSGPEIDPRVLSCSAGCQVNIRVLIELKTLRIWMEASMENCQSKLCMITNIVTCQRIVGLCGGGTRVCNPPLSVNSVNKTSAQARWRHTSGVRECHMCLRGCQETSRHLVRLQREWDTWRNSTVEQRNDRC
jgi:hypothetical protein